MAKATSYINYQSGHGYSNDELIDLGDKYAEYANRDIEEMRNVGINEDFILNFKSKIQEFKEIPTELHDREAVKKTTREKKETRKHVEERLMTTKAQLLYYLMINNESNTTFRNPITGKKYLRLIGHADEFSKVLKKSREKYNKYGITNELIDEVLTFQNLLLEAILAQDLAKSKKIQNSLKRSELKADIYALCKHISTLGKLCWQKKDELKYKDYLITKPKKRGRKMGSKNKVVIDYRSDRSKRSDRWS